MTFNSLGYNRFTIPALDDAARQEFESLVFDPYTGGKQRYRRFSQFKLQHNGNAWGIERLPHRPFIQSRTFNGVVGGQPRFFEPIRFDPTAQVMAGVNAANMDPHMTYQFNVHQVRVIVNKEVIGVAVPEGPHRDGHLFVMNAVVNRSNISGGVTQLIPTGGGEPFFEDVLLDNEAIIIKDAAMWHHATNILPVNGSSGHRDILIITFNEWAHRRYGEEFERNLGVIHADVT